MHLLGSRTSVPTIHRITAVAVACLLSVTGLAATAAPAAAGIVAPDAQTVVRSIIFPVAGPSTYTNTFGACRDGCARGHEGTDIMAPKLTPLVAARDATVSWLKDTATPDGTHGNYLILRDSTGWEYWYVHINNDSPGTDDGANPKQWIFGPGIVRGAKVKAGQLVGYVGDSGNAEWTAPHLHFEIHNPLGEVVNPYLSLQAAPRLPAPVPVDATAATKANESFVRALSEDFLGRAPGDTELASKVAALAAGASRGSIVGAYAGSDEWVQVLIDGFYRSTLGRRADATGKAYWTSVIRAGRTPADVAADFYASDEYYQRVGATPTALIASLYDALVLRPADRGGLAYWVDQLARGASRHQVAFAFYQSIESRLTRVTGLYGDLLGRTPDSAGRAYWAEVLADGHDLRLAAFLASSDEYYNRAGRRFA